MTTDESDIRKLQLELGGNVFELIEFSLTRMTHGQAVKGLYGVNVAKVREVVRLPRINPLSSRVKGIAGVFELRGIPIPAVNLAVALGDPEAEIKPHHQIIVTEFSGKRAGFIVDSTHRIRRVAWEKVLPPTADAGTCISGMTLVEDNEFMFILDLERILLNLEFGEDQVKAMVASSSPMMGSSMGREPWTEGALPGYPHGAEGNGSTKGPVVLLVDDASFIRTGVRQMLLRGGFQVIEASDGLEAFEVLEATLQSGRKIDVIISDIEMPRMDGMGLTRKIREHPQYNETPIILHTSLSGKANQAAGLAVGANGYVIKNDFSTLFKLLGEILGTEVVHGLSA